MHGPSAVVLAWRQVIFTYDVVFKASDIRWASRWDTYLLATDDQVHWFSIINSLMIVLFLRCVRVCAAGCCCAVHLGAQGRELHELAFAAQIAGVHASCVHALRKAWGHELTAHTQERGFGGRMAGGRM